MARKRKATPKAAADRATAYARDVVAERVMAGRYVRLACERHLRDLKRKDIEWRRETAEKALDFFDTMLVLEDTDEGGVHRPFSLEAFQAFIVGSLFGWYTRDGFRRFHDAFIETGKGSGKTPLAAGVGLYGMIADGEAAPEIYSAATTQDQASIAWKDAKRMVEDNPELADLIDVQAGSLSIPSTHAVFRPVSAEHRALDGKRVHIGIVDELHEHPSNVVIVKIAKGTKRRRNALIFRITNSGHDRTSVCYDQHRYSVEVLEGLKENDSWFAYVCTLDLCEACRASGSRAANCEACDDWRDESVWPKTNPGLGTILPIEYLRGQVALAVGMPSEENLCRRLNFCEWTEQLQRWLDMAAWERGGVEPINIEELKALRCLGALDMGSRDDFAAFAKLFGPDEDDVYYAFLRFWIPRASLEAGPSKRTEADRLLLRQWVDAGLIEVTDGTTTDYDLVEQAILDDAKKYDIREIAYDPHDVTQLTQHLRDALGEERLVQYSQAMPMMSPAAKELEKRVAEESLRHGGNPVLRWMASNTVIRHGPNQMIKPDKNASPEKIDGIIALCMALGRAIVRPQEAAGWDGNVMVLS